MSARRDLSGMGLLSLVMGHHRYKGVPGRIIRCVLVYRLAQGLQSPTP